MKKYLLVLLAFLAGCTPSEDTLRNQTVMITNFKKTSGGSGVVIERTSSFSIILTNKHVCEVVSNGGFVIDNFGKEHLVINYKLSKTHDLCAIRVNEDLKYAATLAKRAPIRYESATIIGHPKLLPTTTTYGQFTDKSLIRVMAGLRDCTAADFENPDTQSFCIFIGKVPLIRQFEAIKVTAIIQSGSSGSAVYNSLGELDALAFAVSGDLGFAYAVPFEYIHQFLTEEFEIVELKLPIDLSLEDQKAKEHETVVNYGKLCKKVNPFTTAKRICNQVEQHYK